MAKGLLSKVLSQAPSARRGKELRCRTASSKSQPVGDTADRALLFGAGTVEELAAALVIGVLRER